MTETTTPRTVIVTGGSRGLGEGIVAAYLDRGRPGGHLRANVHPGRRGLAERPGNRRSLPVRAADLSKSADAETFVKAVVDKWGGVDVLVNNAGVARDGILGLVPDDDIDTVIDLNLKGTIYITRLVSRRMLAKRSGTIVNISSIVGRSGYRGLAVYSATKAALDGFTRALARELGSRGITVNGVAPGYLRTEMSHGLDDDQLKQIIRRTPAGRLGEPDDVARAVLFLTDPRNDYMTGQVLVVDGGLTS